MVSSQATKTDSPRHLVFGPDLPVQGAYLEVSFGSHSLRLLDGEQAVEVPYESLTTRPGGWNGESLMLEWKGANGDRTLLLDEPARFQSLVDSLPEDMRKRLQGWRKDVRRSRRVLHVGLVVVIALTMLPLIGVSVLMLNADGIVRRAVDRVPVSWEQKVGKQAYRDLFIADRTRAAGPAAETLARIANQLTEEIDSPYAWDVVLLEDGRANAMALPGGTIVVFSGLLREMRSEEELAGLLAHEIQHVVLRHSLQQTIHDMGMRTVLGVVVFGEGRLGTVDAEVSSLLSDLAYSRQQEVEADEAAALLLQGTAWGPGALVGMLQRIDRSANELPALLVTHPRGPERASAIQGAGSTATAEEAEVAPAWRAVLDELNPPVDD